MKVLLIHDEMLNSTLPVFAQAASAPRIFVFDPAFIQREGWTMKRLQFIADGVAEIADVKVFKGELASVLKMIGATSIITQATPNTPIRDWLERAGVPVEWVDEPVFAEFSGRLTRFTPYWKAIESQWFPK